MTAKRDATLDGIKFVLICLVTIGHSVETSKSVNEVSCILYSVIYSFHMPLFVLLSGYFSKNLDLIKIKRQSLELLETYLVMTIAIGLLLDKNPLHVIFYPSPSCWYLLSLIAWRWILYVFVVVGKIGKDKLLVCSIIIAGIFLFVPFTNLSVFSFMRTTQFFFFFVLGYCIDSFFIEKLRYTSMYRCFCGFGGAFCA